MKLKNIKSIIATTGIVAIATVGIIVSGSGKDDVAEAEVGEFATEITTEVGTEAVFAEEVVEDTVVWTFESTPIKPRMFSAPKKSVDGVKKDLASAKNETTIKDETTVKESAKKSKSKTETKKEEPKVVEIPTEAPTEEVTEETTESSDITETPTTEVTTEVVTESEAPSAYGYTLQYSAVYDVTDNHLTRSNGSIRYNGHRETWYSTNEAAGKNTARSIPGKHVADDGTIRDEDGYVCVASSDLKFYSTVMTSVGPGKVYDCGCSHGTIDVYTTW